MSSEICGTYRSSEAPFIHPAISVLSQIVNVRNEWRKHRDLARNCDRSGNASRSGNRSVARAPPPSLLRLELRLQSNIKFNRNVQNWCKVTNELTTGITDSSEIWPWRGRSERLVISYVHVGFRARVQPWWFTFMLRELLFIARIV